jgi:hypothetical protein
MKQSEGGTMSEETERTGKSAEDLPACKVAGCDCHGFIKNPLVTTDCLECHHDALKHRRAG